MRHGVRQLVTVAGVVFAVGAGYVGMSSPTPALAHTSTVESHSGQSTRVSTVVTHSSRGALGTATVRPYAYLPGLSARAPKARPKPKKALVPARKAKPVHRPPARKKHKPVRVADLSKIQTHNAQRIADAGTAMHVPYRGQVIAIATALQESGLRVYANPKVPASMRLPHQAIGYDHDSVGLFQQRVPMWGSAKSCMDPYSSAVKFYRRLLAIPGWHNLPVTVAAQAVQGSAYPDAYADDANHAAVIRRQLNRRY